MACKTPKTAGFPWDNFSTIVFAGVSVTPSKFILTYLEEKFAGVKLHLEYVYYTNSHVICLLYKQP